MLTPQYLLPIHHELIVDLFAGGGGASTGIEQAIGRPVDIAVNHDREAVSLHEANHPQTRHFVSDVFEVDPLTVTAGQPIGLLWASPDCKHFSKAKGGKPVSKKIRSLAWVVVKWAKLVRPRVICLENVEEFQTWGPLTEGGMPCPNRKGQTFRRWVSTLRGLGYVVEWRELRACDFGAPTIRKRLFLVARRDGMPIIWPEPTHGAPDSLPVRQKRLKPWRTAAECIDWSIPAPSIFERTRPLADATCRRIAKGIVRYVIDAAEPFIVGNAAHTLIQTGYGEREGQAPRALDLDKPLGTVVASQKHALVAAFLAKHFSGAIGSQMRQPVSTVTTIDHNSLVTVQLEDADGSNGRVQGTDQQANDGNQTGRDHLEAGNSRQSAAPDRDLTQEGREQVEARLPHGKDVYGRKTLPVGCAQSGLQDDEGRDSSWHGCEPHRRQERQQPSEQSGVDHSIGKPHSRLQNRPSHTATTDTAACGRENRAAGAGTAKPGPELQPDRQTATGFSNDCLQGRSEQVAAFLDAYYGTDQDPQLAEPLHTVTTRDRFGLVTVKGQPYAIVDIGLRMLTPRELYRAQGFPSTYRIDTGAAGEPITKTAQVRMCGNSVCPPLARAIVAANYTDRQAIQEAA